MTEQDYIDATNLAKLRIAKEIIRDWLPMTYEQESSRKVIMSELTKMISELETKINEQMLESPEILA